jgi:dihydroorotase
MLILIKGGRIVDPEHLDDIMDILIANGKIVDIVQHDPTNSSNSKSKTHPSLGDLPLAETRIIDASGKIVTPGLIDMHVHLREPGHDHPIRLFGRGLWRLYGHLCHAKHTSCK